MIDHDNAWAGSDGPPITLLEVAERGIGHEEQGVTELLRPSLKTVRGGRNIVIPGGLSADEQNPVAAVSPNEDADLDDARENQDRFGLFAEFAGVWIAQIKAPQGIPGGPIKVDALGRACGENRGRGHCEGHH